MTNPKNGKNTKRYDNTNNAGNGSKKRSSKPYNGSKSSRWYSYMPRYDESKQLKRRTYSDDESVGAGLRKVYSGSKKAYSYTKEKSGEAHSKIKSKWGLKESYQRHKEKKTN